YYLGGACYGGLVAFEMATILVGMGQEVGLLALIDTYNHAFPNFLPKTKVLQMNLRFYVSRIAYHVGRVASLKRSERLSYLSGRVGVLAKHLYLLGRLITGRA